MTIASHNVTMLSLFSPDTKILGDWLDVSAALSGILLSARSEDSELNTQSSALQSDHKQIPVLLVDDHVMVRRGLRSVLESYADIEVVGEAWDGEQAVAGTDRYHPAVVVMDINMPKMNGIEATARIKARHPEVIVIGLSVHVGGENSKAMKQAGAALLLTKEAAVDELYRSIQAALDMRS
jgi:CheY-like chemotaxis protein